MTHKPLIEAVKVKSAKKYDFLPSMELVAPLLRSADLTIGNLETVLAGDQYGISGYPTFNGPQILASDLKKSGFNFLTTCNNHSFDKGSRGLKHTLSILDSQGIAHTGTFSDTAVAERSSLLIIKGCRIGILAFTYGTNGELTRRITPLINLIDSTALLNEINSLKSRNADIIIAVLHFGVEYQMTPTDEQRNIVRYLWDNGVSIVFGHHPHVLQPAFFDTSANRFVIFSLGNFLSNQQGNNRDLGGIADITIEKSSRDSVFRIRSASIHPTGVFLWNHKSHVRYSVVLLDSLKTGSLPPPYPSSWKAKADTLSFINNHLYSLDRKFFYADSTTNASPDSSR